jgi:L-lactate dehydrogenase
MTNKKPVDSTRVVIVGAGMVGSSIAYATMIQGFCSELVMIDVNKDRAVGEALDLEHALPVLQPMKVWAGDYDDCADADIVVICAGIAQKPGQTRMDLAATNVKIVSGIVDEIVKRTKDAVIMVVANPLDVLTYVAATRAGLPAGQVFGSGTVLDSDRFSYMLAEKIGVSPTSVRAYLVGEHGDSAVPFISHTTIAGEPIAQYKGIDAKTIADVAEHSKTVVYDIIQKKGATYYGIGVAAALIIRAVLDDEDLVLPVSSVQTAKGLDGVALAWPSVVGRTGVKRVLELSMTDDEKKQLLASAEAIRSVIASLPKA